MPPGHATREEGRQNAGILPCRATMEGGRERGREEEGSHARRPAAPLHGEVEGVRVAFLRGERVEGAIGSATQKGGARYSAVRLRGWGDISVSENLSTPYTYDYGNRLARPQAFFLGGHINQSGYFKATVNRDICIKKTTSVNAY